MSKPSFVYVTYIRSTPEKVWQALTGGRQGWPAILSSLKSLLETGNPLSIKMEPPPELLDAVKTLKK